MNFSDFETVFLNDLKNQNDNCLKEIDENEKLVLKYLGEKKDNKVLKNFVNEFNEVVLINKNNSFNLFEKSLFHPLFKNVYTEFRESDILIRACQEKDNKQLIKWLLTMNINLSVQDDQGMTALMYASKKPELLFALKAFLKNENDDSLYIVDKNNENAFFHAVNNLKGLELLLESKMVERVNQLNKNKDSVLTYCCRNGIYEPVISLIRNPHVDTNVFNNEEKTAFMYLVENGRYEEIGYIKNWKTNFYFKNSKNESALSILIRQYYKYYQENEANKLFDYIRIIRILIIKGCNFNEVIDDEGNTALMFFLWIQDWNTIVYLLLQQKNLDFQIKNKHGINASLLFALLKENEASNTSMINVSNVLYLYISRNDFDINFRDDHGNNILMYFALTNNYKTADKLLRMNSNLLNRLSKVNDQQEKLLQMNYDILNQVNDKKETPLIVASKLGNKNIVQVFMKRKPNLDCQDELGNTALHYALELGDKSIINSLNYYHADINIKNNEGKSPLEIIKESENDELMNLLNNPITPYKLFDDEDIKRKNKIVSLFKKNKKEINQVKINNGDIIISKCNTYRQEYEDSTKCTSKLYKQSDNIVFTSAIQTFEAKLYPIYNNDGFITYYNHEIWKDELTGLLIVDDKFKRGVKIVAVAALLTAAGGTNVVTNLN